MALPSLGDKVERTVWGRDAGGEHMYLLQSEEEHAWVSCSALQTCKEVSLGYRSWESEQGILAQSWSRENRDKCLSGFCRKDPSADSLFSWAEANA